MSDDKDVERAADEILEIQKENEEAERLRVQAALDLETAKFLAGSLDRLSTALATVGVISPVVGYLLHFSNMVEVPIQVGALTLVGCLIVAVILHFVGRTTLKKGFAQ